MAMQGGSDSSSDEQPGHHDAVFAPRAAAAAKRSYECSFCKRGFTNAQALGGHMNIHRRDRAKPSKASASVINDDPTSAFSSGNYNNNYVGHPIFTNRSANQQQIYDSPSLWEAHRDHHQQQRHVFFQQPGGGARGGYGDIISSYNIGRSSHVEAHGYNNLVVPPAPGSGEEVLWGANLSLRVGSGKQQQREDHGEDDEEEALSKRTIWNNSSNSSSSGNDDEHLDLELRLGHQ